MLGKKPQSVVTGVWFLYATLVIGLIGGLINVFTGHMGEAPTMPDQMPMSKPLQIVVLLIILAVGWLIIYLISQGRNWARILYLVLFVLGMVGGLISLGVMPHQSGFSITLMIVNWILAIIGLVFLFRPDANQYFKNH